MNKLLKGTIKLSLALCIVSLTVQAKQPDAESLPVLKQDDVHQVVAKRLTNFFTQAHYRNFALDGAFSAKIFDRYFKMLDGSKAIFIQNDVDTFRNRQDSLGQELFSGNLKTAYDIYNLAMHKRYERYKYALKVLQSPMDFSTNDEIDFDREDISWPTTEKELDAYWDKRVKYDELSLSLSGKDENQIRETLTKRYKRVLKTIEQSNNEDAFQVLSLIHI